MMQSNQPYQRVDDGVGAGLVSGAVVGGAIAGAYHSNTGSGLVRRQMIDHSLRQMEKYQNASGVNKQMPSEASKRQVEKLEKKFNTSTSALKGFNGGRQKAFGGGWKGKAAAYGGSVLAGGLVGATTDALND